jgi:hypothetical protein
MRTMLVWQSLSFCGLNHWARHGLIVGFLWLGLSMAVTAATPAMNVNLLVNPGAETGTTAGWVMPDRQWVAAAVITPHGGAKFFWPGGDAANSSMYQDIDVSALEFMVTSGQLYLHLSGWLANWDQYPHDRATLAIYALDATGNTLDYQSVSHRSPSWAQYRIDRQVPAGTKTLRVHLNATRFVGTDDDGYFDDLSLVLNNALGATVALISTDGQTYAAVGSSLALQATTNNGADTSYVWSSSFEATATVDQNGVVRAVKEGRTTIQARGKDTGAIGVFDLTVIGTNGLVLVEPSANKTLYFGTTASVSWNVVGSVASADLYLSTNGGVNFALIAKIANAAAGSYAWTVPTLASSVNNATLKLVYTGGESTSPLFSMAAPSHFMATSDCVFNWAEVSFPQFFAPARTASISFTPYYFRYYGPTAIYLAASSTDNHVWVLGPPTGNQAVDVGLLTDFARVAGCTL